MTEQTNIPKPASPLPWRAEDRTDLLDAEGGEVAFAYPNEGGGFVDERDALYAAWAANNALKLHEALEDIVEHANTIAPTMPSAIRMIANRALKAARGEA